MERICLCKEKLDKVEVIVYAHIIDECLGIDGHDFGVACKDFFGDDEYEYFYRFDKSSTQKIYEHLKKTDTQTGDLKTHCGMQDLLLLIKANFSGVDGCRNLRDFCEKKGIQFQFSSWT